MVFRLMIKKLFKFEWQVIEIILDPQHRKRKYSLRDIMDAIMYIVILSDGLWGGLSLG